MAALRQSTLALCACGAPDHIIKTDTIEEHHAFGHQQPPGRISLDGLVTRMLQLLCAPNQKSPANSFANLPIKRIIAGGQARNLQPKLRERSEFIM